MDDVELEFEHNALELIAQKAIDRKTGARGLRGIIEESMLDIMYEMPSREEIEKCVNMSQNKDEMKKCHKGMKHHKGWKQHKDQVITNQETPK